MKPVVLCSSMYSEVVSETAFVPKLWFRGHCSAISAVCVTGFGCRTLRTSSLYSLFVLMLDLEAETISC